MELGGYYSNWKLRGKNPRKRDHRGSRPQICLYHPLKSLADSEEHMCRRDSKELSGKLQLGDGKSRIEISASGH